jgi:putative ABC transport system ATP-binding protein
VISLRGITKVYRSGDILVPALRGIDLEIERGEFLAIVGASGSGKSTLMNILGGLDRPSRGVYELEGRDIRRMSDSQLARVRSRRVGFVFQSYNLLARLSAVAQVELPLIYKGSPNRRKLAMRALREVGLASRARHRPSQLSGGEQQRVAVARALVTNPALILADEPTGALDTKTSADLMEMFVRLNAERCMTIVVVTHEAEVAAYARRMIRMRDGLVISDGPPDGAAATIPPQAGHPRVAPA